MNDTQLDELRYMLTRFASATRSSVAAAHANHTLEFIGTAAHPWSRGTLAGHLTASAWVLDRAGSHAVMVHHRKLNRWLQPGGHIEATDLSWHAAAAREVTEETGLARFMPYAGDVDLFDVDVHAIPARREEPSHLHYDLRFKFVADVDAAEGKALMVDDDESHDCRWFKLEDLANDSSVDISVRRMIELSTRPIFI